MNMLFMLAAQNTVVALLLALLVYGLTRARRNPPAAHLLWLLVLLKLVAPPVMPVGRPALRRAESAPARAAEIADASHSEGPSAESDFRFVDAPAAAAPDGASAASEKEHDFAAGWRLFWNRGGPILLGLWLGGGALCVLVATMRIVRFERLLRGTLPAAERLERLAAEIAGKFGIRRAPQVRYAECVQVPLLWCAGGRPTIVLPTRLLRVLDDEQVGMILAHELAHLRRRDHWVRGVELIVSAVYWWNPLVWVIRRQIHQAEDLCCDAWVRWAMPDCTRRYAEVVLKTAESLGASHPGAGLLPASPFLHSLSLTARIEMILEGRFAPRVSRRTMFAIALLALLVLPSFVESTTTQARAEAKDDKTLTAAELRGALERTVRKLEDCHIVAVTRGDQISMVSSGFKPGRVFFWDVWLSGEHAQYRMTPAPGNDAKDDWWIDNTFVPLAAPLTAKDVDTVAGLKGCVRPKGDFVWADSRPLKSAGNPSLYSRSATPRPSMMFDLPLVLLNRAWPANQKGAWFPASFLMDVPVESWKVIGPTDLNGVKTILVEAPKQPPVKIKLNGRDIELELAPFWKVWFSASADEGYFPLRIESAMRYVVDGKQGYAEAPRPPPRAKLVFEAHGITQFAPGLYYPRYGKEETFAVDPENAHKLDLNRIADQVLSEGKCVGRDGWELSTRREWRVLKLERIAPTHDLWFDPPKNAEVYDVNTEARFVQGVSADESRRRLGLKSAD